MTRLRRRMAPVFIAGTAMGLVAGTPAWAQTPPAAEPVAVDPAAPASAAAPTDAIDPNAIVVTARRRAENLLSVPVAISAVNADGLERANILTPQDLARVVPGLTTGSGSTRGFSQLIFTIRGQRNGEPAIAADQSIGVYFAEVPQNASQGLNSGFFDIESVQVLKGPQGTLFGRNATGGAVLIQPNMPTADFGGYVKGTAGSYELRDIEGAINLPITDTLGLRVAGKYTHRDGYLTNILNGRKFNNIERGGARAILQWEPSDGFRTTTIGTYSRGRSRGEGWKLNKLGPPAGQAIIDAFEEIQSLGKYEIINNAETPGFPVQDHNGLTRTWSIQNTTEIGLGGDMTLKNIIGYRGVFDRAISLASGSRIPLQDSIIEDDLNEFSEELQILGETGPLKYVAGLYYFQTRGSEAIGAYNNGLNRLRQSDYDARNTSYSAFAHIDYELNGIVEGLSLSLGGRITHDKRILIRRGRDQIAVGSPTFVCQLEPTVTGPNDRDMCNLRFDVSFTRPTWESSLNWQIDADNLIYASYRRGYRTGGFSSSATNLTIASSPYGPESVDAFELGSKHGFHSDNVDASLTLAGFINKYRDIQRRTNVLSGSNQTFNYTTNAASAQIYGGEAELHIGLFDAFYIDASYAYLKPKYDRWIDPVNVGGIIYNNDISGSRFNDVSRHQITLAARYEVPVGENLGKVAIGANYSYRSSFTTQNEINTPKCTVDGAPANVIYTNCYNAAGVVPGYGIVNARVSWENVANQGFDLSLFVNNVTDKYYSRAAITALSTLGIFATAIGEPRMWGVELRVPFGGER
ncbi:TonB-dependent receptor [Sphingopyxis panaciterrulae]|uniref:Iron complex outermembrane receptor protein n=2 Tax=Sphingopyxis TaxID=165697 RepID=A0A7W9B8G4_9SPHN|nr:TonB-dependent receptor [Sphingopyxis panaciterrulae]MBB5708158.1 iron complex outermembrane receptor protein [Sphingopyxis panaciterrulae]SBV32555.1 putative TonB-dependent receptor [uncultured Sphingopyxis sp.]